ncbi:MAG: LytR C-terminal domain-containing protein [Burkholderiales bacterium]
MLKVKPVVAAIMSAWALGSCASLTTAPAQPAPNIQPLSGVIQDNSHRPEALYQLGRYYQGQLRHQDAIRAYEKALAKNPNLAEARNAIGVIHASEGKFDLAIQEFNAAIALAPDSAHFHNNLGYAYLLLNREEEAVTALEEAQRIDPGNTRAIANMKLARERLNAEDPILAGVEIRPLKLGDPVAAQALTSEPDPQHSATKLVELQSNVYELQLAAAPPAAAAPAKVTAVSPTPFKRTKVEVANGNGITGMARKVARYLSGNGVIGARLTNHKPFAQQVTQIEYREGYKIQAKALNSKLPKPAALIESQNLRDWVDLRLVLGKDISRDVALFESDSSTQKLASHQ